MERKLLRIICAGEGIDVGAFIAEASTKEPDFETAFASGSCAVGVGRCNSGLTAALKFGGNGCAASYAITSANDFLFAFPPDKVNPCISPCWANRMVATRKNENTSISCFTNFHITVV